MISRALKAKFAAAIRRMMRPVVRQMIAYGLSYPAFEQMMKELFVEIAERDFALPYKRQTDSRLAVITGIGRKEVAQLRRRDGEDDGLAEIEDTVATHVVGRWMAGPPYATPDGVPRRLPYEGDTPEAPSFSRLVRDLGVDVPVRAVLDELIRAGSAELLSGGGVALVQEGHIARSDVEGKLALVGSDPAELFSTIVHNIESPEEPWLQRKVVYDNIGSEGLALLQAESARLGEEFLRRANALLSSYDRDRNPDSPGGRRSRVVLGSYYFQESDSEEAPTKQPSTKRSAPPGRIRRTKK